MIKEIIDLGLTAANVLSLINNHKTADTRETQKEVRDSNKQISDFRNAAYIIRRILG